MKEMKFLDGAALASYIKTRHAHQVRSLHGRKITPKLAIVQVKNDPVINTYVRLKKQYGNDIGVEVEIYKPKQIETPRLLNKLSKDPTVHGIIVQLPLADPSETDKIVSRVKPEKDVDALGEGAEFTPATPMAIQWLLAGYNINLQGPNVLIIGRGRLVGAPLEKILKNSGVKVTTANRTTENLTELAKEADIIISAANQPGLITTDMVKRGAVVVDAGVATEEGKTVGNVAPELYKRDDLTITPPKGGVGPLTVCALFENVIRAASGVTSSA